MKFIFLIVCVVVFFMCSDSMHADRKKKRIDKERIAFENKLNASGGSIKKETIKEETIKEAEMVITPKTRARNLEERSKKLGE